MTESARIAIAGGGFGGLYTALRLGELDWSGSTPPSITLIDKSDRFLFSPLLYELITEEMQAWEISPSFVDILANTTVEFKQAEITDIDLEHEQVICNNQNQAVDYDYLVLGIGGKTPLDLVPGATQYAIPFRSLDDAYRLKQRLEQLLNSEADKIRVAVVGGGYSGVELACKLADVLGSRGRIRLVERDSDILNTSTEHNRQTAKDVLSRKQVWLDLDTSVAEMTADTIALEYKGQVDTIPVDIVLWTVGTKVLDLVKDLDLPHGAGGKLQINSTLQVENHPRLYALGDIAQCYDVTGQLVPNTAQAAIQQADYCAWNVWASITGRPLLPFRYNSLGEILSLGTDNATITSMGLKFNGELAYIARRLLYLYRLPGLKHQLDVGTNWLVNPLVDWLTVKS